MPKLTVKTVKEHVECNCGWGYFDQYTSEISIRELISLGYKRRKFKDGNKFYFLHQVQQSCGECSNMIPLQIEYASE